MNDEQSTPKQSPALSVIIPVYNTELYLKQALDSILTQEFSSFEVIAINDGSQDQSGQILDTYKKKDSRIQVYHRKNSGLSATRNFGLEKANGAYIYFFDSDDRLLQGAFTRLIPLLKRSGSEVVTFSGRYIDEDGNKLYTGITLRKPEATEPISGEDLLVKMMKPKIYSPVVSMYMYRKSFLQNKQVTFRENHIHEDEFYTIQTLCMADRSISVPDVFYEHRIRDGSIMRNSPGTQNVQGLSEAVSQMLTFIDKYPLNSTTKHCILSRARELAHNSLRIIHSLNKEKETSLIVDSYFSENELEKLGFDVQLRSKYPTLFRVYSKLKKIASRN